MSMWNGKPSSFFQDYEKDRMGTSSIKASPTGSWNWHRLPPLQRAQLCMGPGNGSLLRFLRLAAHRQPTDSLCDGSFSLWDVAGGGLRLGCGESCVL